MMKKVNFNINGYRKLVNQLGVLYSEFIRINKSEYGPVTPNDHVVGAIGEWRAIEIIKSTMDLDAVRASTNSKSSEDLVVVFKGKKHFISVKTTTEHSSTGRSGIFHAYQGKWNWCLCMRLNEDLTYKEHFWISKKQAQNAFTKKEGQAKQFVWSVACKLSRKEFPNWFKR